MDTYKNMNIDKQEEQSNSQSHSNSQTSHKVINNVFLTLNRGEFTAVAMDESNMIDVSRFLAQRFTLENPRFLLMGIKEEELFYGCLDQCISALATGFGIVILHRDPLENHNVAKPKSTRIVGAFTACDGYDIQFKGGQLKWLKPNPNVSENLTFSNKVDNEFLKPIVSKIQDYFEINSMYKPKLVAHLLRSAVHPDFLNQKLLLVMSSLASPIMVNLGFKMHVTLATHDSTNLFALGLTGPVQLSSVIFSVIHKEKMVDFVFSETKTKPFESLGPSTSAIVSVADYRGSTGEWNWPLEYACSKHRKDVSAEDAIAALSNWVVNEYIPIQKQRKLWLEKLVAATNHKESIQIVEKWISSCKSKL